MISQAVCVFVVMVYSAETLPFSKTNLRPPSVRQTNGNFHGPRSIVYPPYLHLPVQRFPRRFSGHVGSAIRHPVLQVSNKLNRLQQKFDGFIPSRSTNNIIHQQTAQKVRQFGQRVKDTVHHYEKFHNRKMQHMKKILDHRFRLDDMKNRLQQILLKKKDLMKKLHSMGWRGKYVGVPYHTMNDDHMIVKKPGVLFNFYSHQNSVVPILAPVPIIRPIPTQHPVPTEVTTSVDMHQTLEVPASIAGYMFPITPIATNTPEVTETTEITNSIGQEKFTTTQLSPNTSNRYTHTTIASRISMDSSTGSTIVESNTIEIPFNEASAPSDILPIIEDENFGSEAFDLDTTTEIGSTLFSIPSTVPTSQTETNEFPASQTTMLVDVLSGIHIKPITSLVIDMESTTTKIGSTVTIGDDEIAKSIIDTEATIAESISTIPSTVLTETRLGTEETSLQPPALETTTVADEISTIMDTAFRTTEIDSESTSEAIFTIPSTILTERPMPTNVISTTIDGTVESSTIDDKIATEIISTFPSTILSETTLWPVPALELTSSVDELYENEDNRFPSFNDEVVTTIRVDSIFPSTNSDETTTMLTEPFTMVDPYDNYTTIEVERITEIVPTYPSTLSTETSTILEATSIATNSLSAYNSANSDEKTKKEFVSLLPSTISPETTPWLLPDLEITQISNNSSGFRYDRFPSTANEVETTTKVDSILPSTISTETTTMVTEEIITVDPAFGDSTIAMQRTTKIFPTFPCTTLFDETTIFEKTFTTTDPSFDSSTIEKGVTEDVLATSSVTAVPTETTMTTGSGINTFPDGLQRFEYNYFTASTIVPETTTGADSTLLPKFSTNTLTIMIDKSTTIDSAFGSSTNDMEIITENLSALPSRISTGTPAIPDEISTTISQPSSDWDATSKIDSPVPSSTIFPETTNVPPEVTISVDLHEKMEVPTTIAGYMFPITSIAKNIPEVTETTEITNSIGPEKVTTTQQLPPNTSNRDTHTTIASMISVESSTGSTIVESNTIEIPFNEASAPSDILPIIEDENFGSEAFDLDTTTEIGSTLFSISSTVPTSQTETNEFPASQTTMLVDVLSGIHIKSITSLVIDMESTTTKIGSTVTIGDDEIAKSITDTEATIAEFISTIPSTVLTETTLGTEETSVQPLALEKTMVADEISTIMDTASKSTEIDSESTSEAIFTVPSTILTEGPRPTNVIPTTIDGTVERSTIDDKISTEIVSTFPSTILSETTSWSPPASEVTPLLKASSRFEYDSFPSFTDGVEETTAVDSTSYFTILTETTTMATERSTIIDRVFDQSTDDAGKTTEIVPTFPSTISTEITTTSEEITTTHFDNPSIDEETTGEINSKFSSTIPSEMSPIPVSRITTLLDGSPELEHNNFTDSTIAPEKTNAVDSILLSTIPAETTKRLTTSAFETSTFDIGMTTDTDSMLLSMISTETTTSLEEIPRVTDPASNISTDDSETTAEIASSLPATISTEATTAPAYNHDNKAEQNFEYIGGNPVDSNKRNGRFLSANSDFETPRFAYNYEEELDDRTLLNLIPLIIEELRQDNVTPEEEDTMSQGFGDLWPLLKEESKRKHGELMNLKLAIFLFEAGQRISNIERLPKDVATDNLEPKSKRYGSSMKNTAAFLATVPETGLPVRFEELHDKEYKARNDAPDHYNSKYYYNQNDDTEGFSSYNDDQGPNIIELLQVRSRNKARIQGSPNVQGNDEYLY